MPDAAADEDGGIYLLDSGILVAECEEITPVPFIGEDTVDGQYANAIASPADLRASRILASWGRGCDPASVVIMMSDGHCPDGDGHELSFALDASAIDSGVLGNGIHDVSPSSPFVIRYTRPTRRPPAGEWGNCEGASGTLNVRGELGLNRFDRLQA